MSWFPIPKKAFGSDKSGTAAKKENPKKGHWSNKKGIRQLTPFKSAKLRFTKHCPRMCQQRPNGTLGKKTFDGQICNACGYRKGA